MSSLVRRVLPPVECRRGEIRGWSPDAAARQALFLQSVDPDALFGVGYSFTVTLRDRPTAREWLRMRKRLIQFLRDRSAIRWHWTVEWAQRGRGGVPHMHLAVYFPERLSGFGVWALKEAWCRAGAGFGAQQWGQDVKPIRDAVGWSKYCAKHAARTGRHVQREGMPEGWEKSGRMWGKGGDWPVRLDRWILNPRAAVEVKRRMRAFLVADARVSGRKLSAYRSDCPVEWRGPVPKAYRRPVRTARRVLRSDPELGELRGVRMWIPEQVMGRIMAEVAGVPGCVVSQIEGWDPGPWGRLLYRQRGAARERLGLPGQGAAPGVVLPLDPPGPAYGPQTQRQARLTQIRERWGLDEWPVGCDGGPGCRCGRVGCVPGTEWAVEPDGVGVGAAAPGGTE